MPWPPPGILSPACHFHHTFPSCLTPKQESQVSTASPALPILIWADMVAEWAAQGAQGPVGVTMPLSSLPVLPSIPQEKPQPCLIIGEKEYEKLKESARALTEVERWDRLKTLRARQDAAFVGISLSASSFSCSTAGFEGWWLPQGVLPLSTTFWGAG